MKNPLFTGVCTALVTPFLGCDVNYPMLERLLSRQIDAGIKSIVLCGTTGEASTLTDTEKLQIFRRAKEFVGSDCKIIAGTGSNNTAHALHLSIEAEKCGIDGLLLVSPYYNKANPDGLIRHYTAISEAITLPIIVYNVPSRTGLDIPVPVYQELSKIPNIAGVCTCF
jgi:4-hydroxy-tetrahydrodipicolinate synthase